MSPSPSAAAGRSEPPYRRPGRWWARVISRPLGPLPAVGWITYDRQTMAGVPTRFRWLGALAAVAVVATLTAVITAVPVLGTTPVTLALGVDWGGWVTVVLVTAVLVIMPVLARRRSGRSLPALVHQLAINEELWFRAGAERWTLPRRLYSCAAFGFVHLANLVYSIATCGLLVLVGGLFMVVYLRRVRRTGEVRDGVLAAAAAHATYNLVLGAVLYLVVGAFWALTILDLLVPGATI